jgi:hypothetical protein
MGEFRGFGHTSDMSGAEHGSNGRGEAVGTSSGRVVSVCVGSLPSCPYLAQYTVESVRTVMDTLPWLQLGFSPNLSQDPPSR